MQAIIHDFADTLPAPALEYYTLVPDASRFDTVVMGANTYNVGFQQGLRSPYPHLRQYVFSRRFSRENSGVPPEVTVVDTDQLATIRALKAEHTPAGRSHADIWLCGGGHLASTLVNEIDRLILKVYPVLLGSGIPLFADRGPVAHTAKLLSSTPFSSGVIFNEYRLRD
jgi:dihydrofolate reductase